MSNLMLLTTQLIRSQSEPSSSLHSFIQNYSLIKYAITSQFFKKVNKKTIYSLYTEAESSLNGLTVTNEVCSVLSFLAKQLLTSLFAYRPMIRWMVHVSHRTCEDPVPSAVTVVCSKDTDTSRLLPQVHN